MTEYPIMKLFKTRGLICLVLLLILPALANEAVGAGEESKIDLAATAKYVQDWAARDAFPDSPSFAYMNVYCQLALGGQVSDATKKKVVEYIRKCQRPDGGFVANPEIKGGAAAESNVIFTYFALAALDLIDASSSVDGKRAADFVLSMVGENGGIKQNAEGGPPNVGTTYYGIRALHILKSLDRLDKGPTIEYIKSHRDHDKGYGVLPGKPSAPQPTFMAVDSLRLLGEPVDEIAPGVMRFLLETPYSGMKEPENPALVTMDNLSYVLQTAALLSSVQQFNTGKIREFIQSRYIPDNGGFGPGPGLGSTPPGTFNAIECLVILGDLKDPYAGRQ